MSDLDPTGPAQPPLNSAYTTAANPVSKEPAEAREARANALDDSASTDIRVSTDIHISSEEVAENDNAVPTSMARGVRGSGPGEESKGLSEEDVGRHRELDAEQMGAPGEGKVYEAIAGEGLGGRTGGQEGFESDLDRKKAEQAPLREAVQQERQKNVDVGGVLGQRGGPANPVDQDNYPNTSS
ncbi:hypothetical protein EV356DRAFT_256241 [Viridothelium virens]|uniref:Uncharacterized protein n=1 Tax=Viridothelium virens TaxID=1048519 RepID=A0A6A6H462_VIRVR|nr:hypothetical protein EV356DRAFT_256241 [Viridothelium virens]